MMNDLEVLRYPIGRLQIPAKISAHQLQEYIDILENLPNELAETVGNFNDEKFDTPYRENGWTVQQVVTHIAEAHLRAYAMFKHGLEQNNLTIEMDSVDEMPGLGSSHNPTIQKALQTIYTAHHSWVISLKSLSESELNLTFFYPDAGRTLSLPEYLAIFAWHGKHHLGHIKALKERMGW